MPAECKESHAKRRIILSVAGLDEEEKEYNHVAEECEKIEGKESNTQQRSQQ